MSDFETLVDVHKITKRAPDGAVMETEFLGEEYVPMGAWGDGKDLIYAPMDDAKRDDLEACGLPPRRRRPKA